MCTVYTSSGEEGFLTPTLSQPRGLEKPCVEPGPWHVARGSPSEHLSLMPHWEGEFQNGTHCEAAPHCLLGSLTNRQIKGQAALTGTEIDHAGLRILKPGKFWEARGPLGEQCHRAPNCLLSAPGLSPAQTQTHNWLQDTWFIEQVQESIIHGRVLPGMAYRVGNLKKTFDSWWVEFLDM